VKTQLSYNCYTWQS